MKNKEKNKDAFKQGPLKCKVCNEELTVKKRIQRKLTLCSQCLRAPCEKCKIACFSCECFCCPCQQVTCYCCGKIFCIHCVVVCKTSEVRNGFVQDIHCACCSGCDVQIEISCLKQIPKQERIKDIFKIIDEYYK